MKYSMNFGAMLTPAPPRSDSTKFRLALLGDFSGRANSGQLETGSDLAKRKPIKVEFDNIDDVMQRLGIKLQLPIGADGSAVEVSVASMDDLHPDQLYDNVELFSELSGLRQRLKTTSTFAKAAQQVQSWLGAGEETSTPRSTARGAAIPVTGKLSDFAALVGQPTAPAAGETAVDQLLKQIVGPHVVPAKDPKQDALLKIVDQSIADAMRSILHHPDFQTLESLWRSVDFLARRLETGPSLQIILYDITAEEFAADLSSASALEESGLYKLLVEQPAMDAQQGALSVILGNYTFEQTPPHAELLGRMAKIAAAAQAPFIASIGVDVLKNLNPDDVHPLILESWAALRALPESVYLSLTVPRFMLRNPYGDRSDPIDRFEFEEFTPQSGVRGMLWGNSAILAGLLLGLTYTKQTMKKMNLGSILSVGEMPYYFYEDADGDQMALPCTERMINVQTAEKLAKQNLMPILSIRGRPEVRVGGFQSLTAKPLAGPWAPVTISPSGAVVPVAPAPSAPAPAAAPAAEAPQADAAAEAAVEEATQAAAAEVDSDLDALLASLGGAAEEAAAPAEDEMDPGLAALLAELG